MSVAIRLKRMGSSKQPVFRIVAMDKRLSAKKGRVDDLGTFNPRDKELSVGNLKKEKIEDWIKKGAQVTPTVKSILVKLGVKA